METAKRFDSDPNDLQITSIPIESLAVFLIKYKNIDLILHLQSA